MLGHSVLKAACDHFLALNQRLPSLSSLAYALLLIGRRFSTCLMLSSARKKESESLYGESIALVVGGDFDVCVLWCKGK